MLSGFIAGNLFGQVSEKEVFRSVKSGQNHLLFDFIKQGNDVNQQYDNGNYTLLNYAIKQGNYDAVKTLLAQGADPNTVSRNKTPLIFAVIKKQPKTLHSLIVHGADLNKTVKNGNTALIMAAKSGRMQSVKKLVENGAIVQHKNDKGFSALDYANMGNYPDIAAYLVHIIEMQNLYSGLPASTDGPHIEWLNDSLLNVYYMRYDAEKGSPVKKEKLIPVDDDITTIEGFCHDTNTYTVTSKNLYNPTEYYDVDKVIAVGDIHGHYSALANYLITNKVIDKNHNWIWGDGHLVFLGDVFDRGNEVTESLWLINQLDLKARKYGGRVHLLLGNHEVMIMLNDTRYLNRKYEFFSKYFMREPADFFGMDDVLGKWLRTRNTVIKINDCIYSHAGISPAVHKQQISLENINELIREFLLANPDTPMPDADLTNLLLNENGPLWYRGYILDGFSGGKSITERQVINILKSFKASKIIIAHTEVKRMISLFDGKVIAIDVPIRTEKVIPEALLVENGKFYRLTGTGERISCIFEVVDAEAEDQLR